MGATGHLYTDLIFYLLIIGLLFIPKKQYERIRFSHLVILLIVARLSFYTFKIATGRVLYDFDTTYYFEYGKMFLSGIYPQMEYPTGALLLFSLLSWPAKNVEVFRLLFPLLQLPFTLLISWILYSFGKRYNNTYASTLFIIIFALSPATNWLWFHRYDDIAISLFLLSLYYLPLNNIKGTLATTLGFTIKWVPIFSWPAHLILWLKQRAYQKVLMSITLGLVLIVALLLPFYLTDKETFTHTYKTQLNRSINGESLYYAVEGTLDDDLPPYGYPEEPFFTDTHIFLFTIIVALGWLLYLIFRVSAQNVTLFAALSLILFIVTNKIYSTQYIIWILPIFMITAIMTNQPRNELLRYGIALVLLDMMNFIKTPITPDNWLIFSRLFWYLLIGLLYYALRCEYKKRLKKSPKLTSNR